MDFPPPDFVAGASDGRPSPTRRELQGPRPTPLKVNKDSYKIKKPPVAPPPHAAASSAAAAVPPSQNPQTVIIYAVSPKVYHTTVSDFMSVVQRLTGSSSSTETSTSISGACDGNLSPAAKLASIEKASSPTTTAAYAVQTPASLVAGASFISVDSVDVMDIIGNSSVEMCQIPGILSPAPATLPPVSPPGLFSPFPSDPFMLMLSPSPSTLFSAPLISPSPSASDLFHPFFDF
ncbi:unnamed protein product [Withania somnifera]